MSKHTRQAWLWLPWLMPTLGLGSDGLLVVPECESNVMSQCQSCPQCLHFLECSRNYKCHVLQIYLSSVRISVTQTGTMNFNEAHSKKYNEALLLFIALTSQLFILPSSRAGGSIHQPLPIFIPTFLHLLLSPTQPSSKYLCQKNKYKLYYTGFGCTVSPQSVSSKMSIHHKTVAAVMDRGERWGQEGQWRADAPPDNRVWT